MIKLIQKRAKSGLQVSEVHDPTGGLRRLARYGNAHVEGVTVKSGTFMPFRNVGQPVRCFKMKVFVNVHALQRFPEKSTQYKPVSPLVAGALPAV